MLFIFVLSIVPLALAEESSEDTEESTVDVEETKVEPIQKRVGVNDKEAMKRIKETKRQVEIAREKYKKTKERYQEARQKYDENKKRLLEIRSEIKANACESDDCQEERKELRRGVKNHLEKTLMVIENSFEKILDRIENAENLDESKKESLIAEITAMQEKIDAKQEKIETTTDISNEELKKEIKELREMWKEIKQIQKNLVASLTNAKLDGLVEKHQSLEDGMQRRIEALLEQDVDVSSLEEILAQYQEHVIEVEAQHEVVVKALEEAKESGSFTEWREEQRKLRNLMQETRDFLRSFMDEYLSLKEEVESPEVELETEVEVEVEATA